MAPAGDEKPSAPATAALTSAAEVHALECENGVVSMTHALQRQAAIRRVLIPLDGTSFAERGREVGIMLARTCNAQVLLVRCYSERAYIPSGSAATVATASVADGERTNVTTSMTTQAGMQHPLHAALVYLEREQAAIPRQDLTVRTQAVQWPPSFAIVQLANCPLADVVVMATRLGAEMTPRQSSPHASGSVTRAVIEHVLARVPVLLVPASWRLEAMMTTGQGEPMPRKAVVALAHENEGRADDSESHEFTRAYAALLARTLGFLPQEAHMPGHIAQLDPAAMTINATDQAMVSDQVGMFVVGGWRRATLIADAERLLRTARVPVLVVPEA